MHLQTIANRGERISELVGEERDEFVLLAIRLRQREFGLLAIGHVAGRAGHRLDFAVGSDDGNEDVVVDAAAVGPGERHLAANRFLRGPDLIDLTVVHLGVPGLVPDLQERLPDGAVAASAPHPDERVVGIEDAVVEAEHVDEVRCGREHGLVQPAQPLGLGRQPFESRLGELAVGHVDDDPGEPHRRAVQASFHLPSCRHPPNRSAGPRDPVVGLVRVS